MKKSVRISVVAMILMLAMFCLAGCGSGKDIKGTYKLSTVTNANGTITIGTNEAAQAGFTDETMVINLGENGGGNIKFQGQYKDLTYTLEGDTAYLTVEGDTQEATFDGDSLTFPFSGATVVLKKSK